MTTPSKPLGFDDTSAFEFVKEILAGDPTFAINFDRIQWDSSLNCYVIVEFLLCDAAQSVNPHTSHPNRYFNKNAQKFISLWELTLHIGAKLYLVNYAKKGTPHEDKVLLMDVIKVDAKATPPVQTTDTTMTRTAFAQWFRDLNRRGQR